METTFSYTQPMVYKCEVCDEIYLHRQPFDNTKSLDEWKLLHRGLHEETSNMDNSSNFTEFFVGLREIVVDESRKVGPGGVVSFELLSDGSPRTVEIKDPVTFIAGIDSLINLLKKTS